MADPTLPTFCCHHTNGTDTASVIMNELNTDAYNIVCMMSSTLGVLGAIYQILPKTDSNSSHSWKRFSVSRGRDIIKCLAIADLLATLGVLVRSALWINFKSIMPMETDTSSVVFCAVSSAWIQYFYMSTWIWTLCYTVDMKLLLSDQSGHPIYYHTAAWVIPAVLTTFGLIMLYLPDANCHSFASLSTAIKRILPNYCATYLLLTAVMIANPILYVTSTRDLETAVSYSMAQMTGRERKLIQTVRLKFTLTNVFYYICWLPNLINGVLLWTLWFHLPIKVIITLWYIMAVTNPLQAFFNAFVYKRWNRREKLNFEWRHNDKTSDIHQGKSKNIDMNFSESSPLLNRQYKQIIPHASINGSSSL